MCSLICDMCSVKYLKCIMLRIFKVFMRILKFLIKVILCEFVLAVFVIIILTILWNYTAHDHVGSSSPNPTILWWTKGFPGTMETKYCSANIKCDVFSTDNATVLHRVDAYLFYGSNIVLDKLPLPRKSKHIIWGLYHEESPRNMEELMNENLLNLFNLSSTYSRYSDVPYPLQYLESIEDIVSTKYFVPTAEKNKLLNEISPVIYLQSDCETSTERDVYVEQLMKFINIDSYGECLKNKVMPKKFQEDYLNNLNEDEFLNFVARYKFVVAIENGVCEDYITEKFWRAIKVGTIPIYLGSPTIKDWFPNNKSAILLHDYPTPEVMSRHLNELLKDDDLYESYLEHKIKGVIKNKKLSEEFRLRPYQNDSLNVIHQFECLVCKKLHEMRKGDIEVNIVSKRHYNCPKPISALSLNVNPHNSWVYSWESAMERADQIYKKILNEE